MLEFYIIPNKVVHGLPGLLPPCHAINEDTTFTFVEEGICYVVKEGRLISQNLVIGTYIRIKDYIFCEVEVPVYYK